MLGKDNIELADKQESKAIAAVSNIEGLSSNDKKMKEEKEARLEEEPKQLDLELAHLLDMDDDDGNESEVRQLWL